MLESGVVGAEELSIGFWGLCNPWSDSMAAGLVGFGSEEWLHISSVLEAAEAGLPAIAPPAFFDRCSTHKYRCLSSDGGTSELIIIAILLTRVTSCGSSSICRLNYPIS